MWKTSSHRLLHARARAGAVATATAPCWTCFATRCSWDRGWREYTSATRRRSRVLRAPELRSERFGEAHRGFDLHATDRDALDVDAEGNFERGAVRDQLGGCRERLLVGGFEWVSGVSKVVLDPPRHVDAEPPQEGQRLHRPADREREDERDP